MKTKYSKFGQHGKTGVKTSFTHAQSLVGFEPLRDDEFQDWNNVQLLPTKLGILDQFLVWNDSNQSYHILLGTAGTEFDNV